ncbi:uncharacterized protein BP01DRAFT_87219 [Aspergillus saccharolyticus JOP 1030-1]|uniref:Uncharacterized protein n=1 Tax=Aspergillus saccharolyticus JOP 1030-1 TaxID=1450539 RepID=A0A318ZKL1_9EURO|nr:hypothetical protein BP01DRAFT_87219 [Aspergillus saccharolyticus JOP 1030-1]PYH44320.1 hypothetical protein BP01DRAFT_87219 [Aspergillus saccharolyticus JOP 1030-1]
MSQGSATIYITPPVRFSILLSLSLSINSGKNSRGRQSLQMTLRKCSLSHCPRSHSRKVDSPTDLQIPRNANQQRG